MIFFIAQCPGWYDRTKCNIKKGRAINIEELKRRGDIVLAIKRKL